MVGVVVLEGYVVIELVGVVEVFEKFGGFLVVVKF